MDKKDLWYLFLQIIPVMVGVYLGFWLSERGDQQHIDQQVDKLETLIISEIESNKREITEKLEYHNKLVITFNEYLVKENGKDQSSILNAFKGLQTPKLKDACYQSGIQTGLLTNFKIEEVALLNEIISEQNSLNKYSDAAISALLTSGSFEEADIDKMIGRVMMNLNDISGFEKRLIKYYDKALEAMK